MNLQLLQEANKLATENYDKELARIKLDSALDMALTGAKGKNPKAIKALLDMDKIKLDEEGLKGLEDQLASLKTNESYLFETETKIEQPPMQGFQPTQEMQNWCSNNKILCLLDEFVLHQIL